jgi:hypothetical protein
MVVRSITDQVLCRGCALLRFSLSSLSFGRSLISFAPVPAPAYTCICSAPYANAGIHPVLTSGSGSGSGMPTGRLNASDPTLSSRKIAKTTSSSRKMILCTFVSLLHFCFHVQSCRQTHQRGKVSFSMHSASKAWPCFVKVPVFCRHKIMRSFRLGAAVNMTSEPRESRADVDDYQYLHKYLGISFLGLRVLC